MKNRTILVIAPTMFLVGGLFSCKGGNTPTPTPTPTEEWINKDNWYELTSSATVNDIGKTANVVVNGLVHKVRLIDIDHDIDENDSKIHTTWEFANPICDKFGYSIAYQWSDLNIANESGNEANCDYINSTIRYALCGQGNNGGKESDEKTKGTVLAATRGGSDWDNEYRNKTVISMLPEALVNKLKTVKKSVGITKQYVETSYTDKLFMASGLEMGYGDEYADKGYGTVYTYYKSATKMSDPIRKKDQISNIMKTNWSTSIPHKDECQSYSQNVNNYAGFNYDKLNLKVVSGKYWLRSPYIPSLKQSDFSQAYFCDFDGELVNEQEGVYKAAYGIAPLFCI